MIEKDQLVEEAWTLTSDLGAMKKRYDAVAKKDDEVGLALARFEHITDEMVLGAFRVEGKESSKLLVPLVVATCLARGTGSGSGAARANENDANDVRNHLQTMKVIGTPEAGPALHQIMTKAQTQSATLRAKPKTQREADTWMRLGGLAASCLAMIGDTKPAENLLSTYPTLLTTLVMNGVAVDAALARLERGEDDEDDLREIADLLRICAEAKIDRAVPAMIRCVRRGIFVHALDALATIGDPRGADVARKILRETVGDAWSVNILRLSAEHVLRAHGEKLPLDLARASVHWPIIDYRSVAQEAIVLRKMAITALVLHGDDRDKKIAQAQIQSPYRLVREAAAKAFASPPTLVAWDPGRVAFTKKKAGVKALAAALEDPRAIYRDSVVKVLAEDAKSKAAVANFIVREIESRMTGPYDDDIELDTDIETYVEVGEEIAEGATKKIFAASKNPWIQIKILSEDEEPFSKVGEEQKEDAQKKANIGKKKANVARFDAPPYAFPAGITKVVLADDAERVLVVGPESFLFDPQQSERLLSLGDGTSVSACAIAGDGRVFAFARGNKITIYDGKTGAENARTEVASTITALAFSPDAKALACGTDAGALRIFDTTSGKEMLAPAKDAPGHVRGVGWLSQKRVVFLADKGKKSVLIDIADTTKDNKRVDVAIDASSMLATRGKLLVTAGGKNARVHDAKLAPKTVIDCDEPVLGVAIESDKALVVRFEDKVERVRFGGKAPKHESISSAGVSALAASGGRVYGVVDGTMMRYHEDKKGKIADGVHYEHVTAIAVLPSGEIITTGWEGRVHRWKREGGLGETLFVRDGRVDCVAVAPKGDRIYFDDEKNVRSVDLATREVSVIVGGEDVEKDIAEHMPDVKSVAVSGEDVLAWGDNAGTVHLVKLSTGEEIAAVSISTDDVETLAFSSEDDHFYAGTDDGEVACIDVKGTKVWARVEHGIDVLNGKLHGNPHRTCASVDARAGRLATLASDDTVRVFDGVSGERKLRCYRNVGIFNQVAISPSGRLVAFTFGTELDVRAIDDGGALECHADAWPGSGGSELTSVAWEAEDSLLVGTEGGAIFRVTMS